MCAVYASFIFACFFYMSRVRGLTYRTGRRIISRIVFTVSIMRDRGKDFQYLLLLNGLILMGTLARFGFIVFRDFFTIGNKRHARVFNGCQFRLLCVCIASGSGYRIAYVFRTVLVRERGLIMVRLVRRINFCTCSSQIFRVSTNLSEITRNRVQVRFLVLWYNFVAVFV